MPFNRRDPMASWPYDNATFNLSIPCNDPTNQAGTIAATTGGFREFNCAHLANVTIVNNGTGPAVVTWYDDHDISKTFTVLAGSPLFVKKQILHRIEISGSNLNLGGAVTWPEEISPESIVVSGPISVQGTVKTDLGQGTGVRDLNQLLQGGQLPSALDPSGGLKTDGGQQTVIPDASSPTGKAVAVKTE